VFNPEGRIPVLLLPDGRKMTQSGPIIDYIESHIDDVGSSLVPEDPWVNANIKRLMWIIAADIQPYQNIPFIIQAMSDWGMVKASPTEHPLRLHFIRREFGAVETIMEETAGKFSVGNKISLADCFLVPQIRNALLAGIDLDKEFPTISKIFLTIYSKCQIYLRSWMMQEGLYNLLPSMQKSFKFFTKKIRVKFLSGAFLVS